MKLFKTEITNRFIIEGVVEGSVDSFVYENSNPYINIKRRWTGIYEIYRLHYSKVETISGSVFNTFSEAEDYINSQLTLSNTNNSIFVKWKGVYDPVNYYTPQDLVTYTENSFINISSCSGIIPLNTNYWSLMASSGLTITGPQGLQGTSGLTITGPQGLQGTSGLTITGPQGLQGTSGLTITGPQGIQGVSGTPGYISSTSLTVTIPSNSLEYESSVVYLGIISTSIISIQLSYHIDTDENHESMLDIRALTITPSTDSVTINIYFSEPSSGDIKLTLIRFS